ncbi:MAG: heme ABC exporter ATP-binding protein CcmA [Pseudomonadota bacterium]
MADFDTCPHLTCRDLGCDRGGRPVVRGVSFDLPPGGALQIFGRNGAGKSSLLAVLGGRAAPTAGEVDWTQDGAPLARTPAERLAVLDHDGAVKPQLSVDQNLLFWKRLYGASREACAAVLDQVGLKRRRAQKAASLSAGERRRLALARVLLAGRPIWLLDEPTASVDAAGEALAADLVNAHLARGGSAVIATHHRLALQGEELTLG